MFTQKKPQRKSMSDNHDGVQSYSGGTNRPAQYKKFAIVSMALSSVACGTDSESFPSYPSYSDDSGRDYAVAPDGQGRDAIPRELPAEYIDDEGLRWKRTRAVEFVEEEEGGQEHLTIVESESDIDFAALSFEKFVEAMRPYMQYGGYEYTLVDDDAERFARDIYNDVIDDRPVLMPSSMEFEFPGQEDDSEIYEGQISMSKVVGNDNRVNINAHKGNWPYNTIAQMWDAGHCTGFKLINEHTAVTSAHCVHNGTSGGWKARKNMRFGNRAPTGKNCYGMTVPGCWISGSASCDYAVIRLRNASAGYGCSVSTYNTGWLGSMSPPSNNIPGYLWGYPSANMPSGWSYPTLSEEFRNDGYVSTWYPDRVFYKNDSTGGMSGGPYIRWIGPNLQYVMAVNKGGFQWPLGGYEHYGPRVNASMINFLVANAGN
jgi:V8-like Glu-specific endopeptidase